MTRAPGRGVGVAALLLAIVAAVVAPIVGGVAAFGIGQGVGGRMGDASAADLTNLRILTPVRDLVLVGEVTFWTGTVVGVAAIVAGIVAVVRRRGRGLGIAALVVAPVGFVVFVVVVWFSALLGLAAVAATGSFGP